jgi:hypothetical protein
MAHQFSRIMFTDSIKKLQERYGSLRQKSLTEPWLPTTERIVRGIRSRIRRFMQARNS